VNPLALRWLTGAAGLLAILGLVTWVVHDLKAAGGAEVIAAQSAQRAADAASVAARDQHTEDTQKEARHEADRFNALADAGAHAAADGTHGLQQRFRAAGACAMPASAAAAADGAAAATGAGRDVRADVFDVVVAAGQRLAARCDKYHGPGAEAARDYDALTP
jgi:hypothetical protein